MDGASHSDQQGQSIILVALAFVALLVFAAVAVDLSSAYYHRRVAQNAADAAAFAGAKEVADQRNLYGKNIDKKSNGNLVKAAMNGYAERDGIADTDGTLGNEVNTNVEGWYIRRDGSRISPIVIGSKVRIPQEALGVEALTYLTAPSFFGQMLGYDSYAVSADAAVSLAAPVCGVTCVVPVATYWDSEQGDPEFLVSDDPDVWQVWTQANPPPFTCYNIWNGDGPGNFGWLNWSLQEIHCAQDDCSEQCLQYNLDPAHCAGYISIGDYVAGTTGVVNGSLVREQLDKYTGDPNDLANKPPQSFTVPVWESTNGSQGCGGSGLAYRVQGFAVMQLIGYKLPQGQQSDPWFDPADPDAVLTLCSNINPPGDDPNAGNRLTAYFKAWIDPASLPGDCDPSGTITGMRMFK
jgi:hypothetical protein